MKIKIKRHNNHIETASVDAERESDNYIFWLRKYIKIISKLIYNVTKLQSSIFIF